MYNEKEFSKIKKKLKLINDKMLLDEKGNIYVVKDWFYKTEKADYIIPFKQLEKTKYIITSIKLLSYSVFHEDSFLCSNAGVQKILKWRSNFLNMESQLKEFGYKLNIIKDE